jgi:putative SOS response-associated peptidase YedK
MLGSPSRRKKSERAPRSASGEASPKPCPICGEPFESSTILTTTPNAAHQLPHDRMPVILPSSAYSLWLDPAMRDVEPIQALLTPYPADAMIAYPVRPRVNNPAYDAPECIALLT